MKDVNLPEITSNIAVAPESKEKKSIKFIKKKIFVFLLLVLMVLLVFFVKQRVAWVSVDGKRQLIISNTPISHEQKNIISIKPGYYYSKLLIINIIVPQGLSGEEYLGVISLKNDKKKGEIIIERTPTKYSSLEDALKNTNNSIITEAEVTDFSNENGHEGKSVVNGEKYEEKTYRYFFYFNHYIYQFSESNPALFYELHDLAFRFQFSDQPITPPMRKAYDFNKIMDENFKVYENKEAGFSISYPKEADIEYLNYDQILSGFGKSTADHAKGDTLFSLISQPPGAYELYDALTVDLIYSENTVKKNLNQLVSERVDYDSKSETGTKLEKYLSVNNIEIAKLTSCCYAGGTREYIFLTKANKYFVEIIVFSPGKDHENFEKVADKMIDSLDLLN